MRATVETSCRTHKGWLTINYWALSEPKGSIKVQLDGGEARFVTKLCCHCGELHPEGGMVNRESGRPAAHELLLGIRLLVKRLGVGLKDKHEWLSNETGQNPYAIEYF